MYLHRYLRYTPTLAVIILFSLAFTKFLGSGPFFDARMENCAKYWWSALLHVTVYVNPVFQVSNFNCSSFADNAYFLLPQCIDVAWYLSVDFQLFVISPLLIYPVWKYGKKAFWILPTLVLLVQGCLFVTTYRRSITVTIFQMTTLEGIFDWLEKFYFPTHLRLGSWVIGIMLGFVIYHRKGKKIEINKFVDTGLWVTSLSVLLAICLLNYPFIQMDDNQTTRFTNSLYNTCFRICWGYSVAWIIFACHNGSGGIVRWFLSLKQWQPFGKLGLSIYLVHRTYQIITVINEKQPIIWNFFTQTQKFYGDAVVSVFLGIFLHLCIECPVLSIENYLHHKIKGSKLIRNK